jgi:hypothetical protein
MKSVASRSSISILAWWVSLVLLVSAALVAGVGPATAASSIDGPPAPSRGAITKAAARKLSGPPDRVGNHVRDAKGQGRDKGAVKGRDRELVKMSV